MYVLLEFPDLASTIARKSASGVRWFQQHRVIRTTLKFEYDLNDNITNTRTIAVTRITCMTHSVSMSASRSMLLMQNTCPSSSSRDTLLRGLDEVFSLDILISAITVCSDCFISTRVGVYIRYETTAPDLLLLRYFTDNFQAL